MRQITRVGDFSVRAISGTRAVILAMNADKENLDDFLGFGIGVQECLKGQIRWLNGFKCFKSLEDNPERAQRFSTVAHRSEERRVGKEC